MKPIDFNTCRLYITLKLVGSVTSVTPPSLNPYEARSWQPVYTELARPHSCAESVGKEKYTCTYCQNQISHSCERGNKTILITLTFTFSDSR
jgi:hypothetical protein